MEFKEFVNSLPNQRNEVFAGCQVRPSTDGCVGILFLIRSSARSLPIICRSRKRSCGLMYEECGNCKFHRNCINGLYCLKLKKYVQYNPPKICKTKTENL